MYILNNAAVCRYWLERLRGECGAAALLGALTEPVEQMAKLYGAVPVPPSFYAEVRLRGEPGLDLSAQYPALLFRAALGQALWPEALARQEELFRRYAAYLERMPQILQVSNVYLEADTHLGAGVSSCFFDTDELVLTEMLAALQAEDGAAGLTAAQREATELLLHFAAPQLHLHRFGVMLGRAEQPLRLEFYAEKGRLAGLLAHITAVCTPPAEAPELLRELDAAGLFEFMLTVDVLPGGNLGRTLGLELFPAATYPREQRAALQSEAFGRCAAVLRERGLADERLALLAQCCFEERRTVPRYSVLGLLSHLKLSWTDGVAQPAKAYLQLRIQPQQASINASLRGWRG